MAVSSGILGMNARNFKYVNRYNTREAKRCADDKIATKLSLKKHDISAPRLFTLFSDRAAVKKFAWDQLPKDGFVLKPARGYGGGGIIVMSQWFGTWGRAVSGEEYTDWQLQSHALDILDGNYSLNFLPDQAFIEDLVRPHPVMRKLTPHGLPDIRVIVFQKIPIMAMLRLPTAQSHGTANLHQGAVGCGIEMRTGITTGGIVRGRRAELIPGTRTKLRGIKLPDWDVILDLAIRTQTAVGLGYAGVDIVLDKKRGPLVLEVNARPGLSIQLANMDSLRSRLERVEGITVSDAVHGLEIAKSLFAENRLQNISSSNPKVLGVIEDVVFTGKGDPVIIRGKMDTGARRTSIDLDLAKELGLEPLNRHVHVQAASGNQIRKLAKVSFLLGGKRITTRASLTPRHHLRYRMIVGRDDLKGFLIDPNRSSEGVK